MGVHAGFADLIVISGRPRAVSGGQKRNRPIAQIAEVFRDTVCAQASAGALGEVG